MIISNNIQSNVNFKAKYFYTEDLYNVVKYAVEKGKFDRLNEARKRTDAAYLVKRLKLNLDATADGRPVVTFTRMIPRKGACVPYKPEDYVVEKTVSYESLKKTNPLKFALEKLIKLGNNAPDNKMFKNVVINK